jgi:hypothetical protein
MENTEFRKLHLLPPSDERKETPTLLGHLELTSITGPAIEARKTPILLGLLKRVNLSHWTSDRCLPPLT